MYISNTVSKLYRISNTLNTLAILKRTKCSEINIVKSKSLNLVIPNQLIHEYTWQHLHKWPHKTAVICFATGKSYTYEEIYRKSWNLARQLQYKFKLNVGDTVAVVLPNVPDFPIAFLGALQAGLIVTTVNPFYTADEMVMQFEDSKPKVIFTVKEVLLVINSATATLRSKVPTILAETNDLENVPGNYIKLSELCDNESNEPLEHLNPNNVALLPYSSGTTGLSKGVQLTHKNVVSNLYQMSSPDFIVNLETQGDFQDVVPVVLPLFHIYGMVGIFLNFFAQGCKLIMVSNFIGTQFIKLLEIYKPTLMFAVPPMIIVILNNQKIKFENLKSVRTIISAAAPLGILAMEQFHEKCRGRINLLQMYGMTETSPLTLMQTTKLEHGNKIGGSGFLIPNTEAKIVPPENNGRTAGLRANEFGELVIRGPQVMKGYHNNLEATKDVIIENNWLRTGDICYYDEHQHFFITDRLKELIKVKGFQVAPAELEDILKSHSSVQDAAVVGVSHPIQGEAPKAFVVLRGNSFIKPQQLKDYVASKVATYKRLVGGVVIIDKLPRNCAGKLLRRELRDM